MALTKITGEGVGSLDAITIGDGTAADKKILFDGNAQDFHIGLDDSADSLTIGLGSTLGTTSHMVFDSTGAITKPNQPSFLAHPASTIVNISAGQNALTFGTERFDRGADYNTSNGTFTAPVTGLYQLNVHFYMLAVDTAATYYEGLLITSNKTYGVIVDPNFSADMNYYHMELVVLADMDAADTATIRMDQSGGTAQTDISGNATFSGYLVA